MGIAWRTAAQLFCVVWLCDVGMHLLAHGRPLAAEVVLSLMQGAWQHRWLLRPVEWPAPPAPTPRQRARLQAHLRRYPHSQAALGAAPEPAGQLLASDTPLAGNGTVQPVDLPLGLLCSYHLQIVLTWPAKVDAPALQPGDLRLLVREARPVQYAPGHLRFYPIPCWLGLGPEALELRPAVPPGSSGVSRVVGVWRAGVPDRRMENVEC